MSRIAAAALGLALAVEAVGGTGFPMTGGAGGSRRETERHRQAWMAEDADVWAGEAETAPHAVTASPRPATG